MNILITVHTYYPKRDGVQFVTKYLAEGLAQKGHKVQIITYDYNGKIKPSQEVHNGVNILRWNAYTSHTYHYGDKTGYQQYILDHQSEYDVMVNVGTQTALTDWLYPIFDKIKIPKLLYIHSIWDFHIYDSDRRSIGSFLAKLWANIRWGIYYKTKGNIFRQYDIVTQLHEHDWTYAFFKDRYGIESRVIENAADDIFFERQIDDSKSESRYIINVANYNERKNQKECLTLFYESDVPDDWKMVLVGSEKNGYYNDLVTLNNQMRQLYGLKDGQKEVSLLCAIERSKVCELVKNASLYLMTSTWEAFPISLTESMAAGVPFISSDVGIVKWLPGGITASSHTDLLSQLNRFGTDENLRQQYGLAGHAFAVEHLSKHAKVDQLESYLLEIKNKKG